MDLTEQQKRELAQHYQWWGLTAKQMEPFLTPDELDLLYKFSIAINKRLGTGGLLPRETEDQWPMTHDERWEALK